MFCILGMLSGTEAVVCGMEGVPCELDKAVYGMEGVV